MTLICIRVLALEVSAVSRHEVPRDPDDVYGSFVRELAASPGRADLLGRLRLGHGPDEHGWCKHSGHAHHWERHPCPMLRMATLVDGADGQG